MHHHRRRRRANFPRDFISSLFSGTEEVILRSVGQKAMSWRHRFGGAPSHDLRYVQRISGARALVLRPSASFVKTTALHQAPALTRTATFRAALHAELPRIERLSQVHGNVVQPAQPPRSPILSVLCRRSEPMKNGRSLFFGEDDSHRCYFRYRSS